MPFKSEKQRRFLWLKHPDIAKRWAHEYKTKKDLPMYVKPRESDKKEEKKEARFNQNTQDLNAPHFTASSWILPAMSDLQQKQSESNTVKVDLPDTQGPTYAGQEQTQIKNTQKPCIPSAKPANADETAAKAMLGKIAAVISPKLLQEIEDRKARKRRAQAAYVPQNVNLKAYPVGSNLQIPPPIGMTAPPQPAPQQAQAQPQAQPQTQAQTQQSTVAPVGDGSSPMFNPINSFGALSSTGVINGNAAFGTKNSPDSLKTANAAMFKRLIGAFNAAPARTGRAVVPPQLPRPALRAPISSPMHVVSGGTSNSRPGATRLYVQHGQTNVPVRQFAQNYRRDRLQARNLLMQKQPVPAELAARLRAAGHLTENPAAYSQLPAALQRPAAGVVRPMLGVSRMKFSPVPAIKTSASWETDGYAWDDKPTRVFRDGFTEQEWQNLHKLSPADLESRYLAGLDAALTKYKNLQYRSNHDDPEATELSAAMPNNTRREFVQKLLQQMQTERPFTGALGVPVQNKTAALGLWDRIRAKKKRGEKPAKPGDKDYPDAKSWKKVTEISEKKAYGGDQDGFAYGRWLEGGEPSMTKDYNKQTAANMTKDLAAAVKKHGGKLQFYSERYPTAENTMSPEEAIKRILAAEALNAQFADGMPNNYLLEYPQLPRRQADKLLRKDPTAVIYKEFPAGEHPLYDVIRAKYLDKQSKQEKKSSTPAWQRAAGKNEEGGLNAKGRASYNRATGGNLKAPVTESKPTGERAKRRSSFCSRMCGMKKHETGSKTKKDPDSRINKALRKWNCKCGSEKAAGALRTFYAFSKKAESGIGGFLNYLQRPEARQSSNVEIAPEFKDTSLESLSRLLALEERMPQAGQPDYHERAKEWDADFADYQKTYAKDIAEMDAMLAQQKELDAQRHWLGIQGAQNKHQAAVEKYVMDAPVWQRKLEEYNRKAEQSQYMWDPRLRKDGHLDLAKLQYWPAQPKINSTNVPPGAWRDDSMPTNTEFGKTPNAVSTSFAQPTTQTPSGITKQNSAMSTVKKAAGDSRAFNGQQVINNLYNQNKTMSMANQLGSVVTPPVLNAVGNRLGFGVGPALSFGARMGHTVFGHGLNRQQQMLKKFQQPQAPR